MECFRSKAWIVAGVISLIIGGGVLLGAYRPYRQFNDAAVTATCTISTEIRQYLCRNGAVTRECYDIIVVTRAVPTCGTYITRMTVYDKALAEKIVASNPPYSRSCYYVNQCDPKFSLDDVNGSLWAGCIFTSIAAVCLAFPIAAFAYDKWRARGGYSQIENETPI